jgi:hypothetical protein
MRDIKEGSIKTHIEYSLLGEWHVHYISYRNCWIIGEKWFVPYKHIFKGG